MARSPGSEVSLGFWQRVADNATTLRCLLAIAIVATLFSLPYLIFGISYGMSHLYNISWSQWFTAHFLSGEWYPRWLNELNGGLGSLVFWIYAPLPFFVTAITGGVVCHACQPSVQLAVGEYVMLMASGGAFFLFIRQYGPNWAAAIGAIYYMLAPYHFEVDLLWRQAVGEFAAYIWMPLILLFFQKSLVNLRYLPACALCYAALVFTHLPGALLFSLVLPVVALLYCIWNRSILPLAVLAAAVVFGIGIAGVYLVPALFMQSVNAYSQDSFHYWHYYGNWFFFDGQPEPDTKFATRVMVILVTGAVAAALMAVTVVRSKPAGAWRSMAPWLLALAVVLFMVSPLSAPVWELIPFLQQVQFPWRIMVVTDVAVASMLVLALSALGRHSDGLARAAMVGSALLLVVTGLAGWRQLMNFEHFYPPAAREVRRAAQLVGADTPEYQPMWARMYKDELLQATAHVPKTLVLAGSGEAEVLHWNSRDIALRVNMHTPADLQVRQFYLPWWRARSLADGTELPVSPTPLTGLAVVRVPAGQYDIQLDLPPLRQERLGLALSLLSLVGVILVALGWQRLLARP